MMFFLLIFLCFILKVALLYLIKSLIEYSTVGNRNVSFEPLRAFFSLIILAPLSEEVLCRLWLKKGKYNLWITIITSITCIILFSLSAFTMGNLISISLLVVLPFIVIILNKYPDLYTKYWKSIFYFSAIMFSFLHSRRYDTDIFITLLATTPHLISGIFLGYIRVIYGFKYGVLFHALLNLIVFIIIYILRS
jgi:membrane protease YdiL (CAAX protease family)